MISKMKTDGFHGKKVLILGLGVSGRSAAHFLIQRGAAVTGVDKHLEPLLDNSEIQALMHLGLKVYPEEHAMKIEPFSLVIASPGISSLHPLYLQAKKLGKELIGEIELACREIRAPFIGVTGTNGKTTVSLLLGHIFNTLGRKAKVLGNAGIPLTREIGENKDTLIVCELSSFQLETMEQKIVDYAAILNITPDHLDRYSDMEAYARAKLSIARCLKNSGKLYVGETVLNNYSPLFKGIEYRTFGFHSKCDLFCDMRSVFFKENIELFLPEDYRGKSNHDVENIMAAFALCHEMGIGPSDFLKAFTTFKKPPHRIEFVKKLRGVTYYDDSKGTNLDAVIKAVESMPGKVILIAGGVDKGIPFTPWLATFKRKVKALFAIGQAKEKLKRELLELCPVILCESLEIAVEKASDLAEEGDSVLLSPGCASFDMFKNYEHRGDRFREIVHALDKEGEKGDEP